MNIPNRFIVGQRVRFIHEYENDAHDDYGIYQYAAEGETGTVVHVWPDLIWPVVFVRLDCGCMVNVEAVGYLEIIEEG